jgi:hypothetical protein
LGLLGTDQRRAIVFLQINEEAINALLKAGALDAIIEGTSFVSLPLLGPAGLHLPCSPPSILQLVKPQC